MPSIYELIPDHELLLDLEPEELAGIVLEYLKSLPAGSTQLNRYNFGLPHTVEGYPLEHQESVRYALMEAWMCLEKEGLIASKPGETRDSVFVTRRGISIEDTAALEAYRRGNLLPKRLLHSLLVEDVWLLFSRGHYHQAVLQAFKAVEVAVRNAGGYPAASYGVDLMRQAFHAARGPLTDVNQLLSEREAAAHLFAGAIGLYKNPQSHRNVLVTADEAAEIIIFASHLLRIIDSRDLAPTQ